MNTPITELLRAWGEGDKKALDQLVPLVHDELRRLASRQMRKEKSAHTLQTTALINEAYCKLIDVKNVQWQNRAQFFAIASKLMRRILIDHAKTRARAKRGGYFQKITLDSSTVIHPPQVIDLLALDRALQELAKFDEKKSRIVEMKFFGGLTTEEIAEVEQISKTSVEREWRTARAWLFQAIRS